MMKKILVISLCLTLLVGLVLTPDVSAKRKAVEIRTWMYLDDAEEVEGDPWNEAPINPSLRGNDRSSDCPVFFVPFIGLFGRFQICIPRFDIMDDQSGYEWRNSYRTLPTKTRVR